MTNVECRQYLVCQAFESSLDLHSFHYVVESLGLDGADVFKMHREVNSIAEQDALEAGEVERVVYETEDLLSTALDALNVRRPIKTHVAPVVVEQRVRISTNPLARP